MICLIARGLLIPFFGTAIGAVSVYFMRKEPDVRVSSSLTGVAAGVMTAASVWSLLIPAIEQMSDMGAFAFIPAVTGLLAGMVFIIALNALSERLHFKSASTSAEYKRTLLLTLAVVLHNIPEGMAVGVAFSSIVSGGTLSVSDAMALSIGIAIQNMPEGAIISLPLSAQGKGKHKACLYGVLSGAVEPVAGLLTVLLTSIILPLLPYMLSFAAGCMLYVVVDELVPEEKVCGRIGGIMFIAGFAIMMMLDVALG